MKADIPGGLIVSVMAGLVPAIRVFSACKKEVAAWHEAGHDDR